MNLKPPSCRVLVVDDCHDTIESLALLLACWGHDVRSAADGFTALEIASEYQPDVVLLDLAMPVMDGLEVARRLRHDLHLDRACIVALSGYGREEDQRHAHEAGCDHHFLKPLDPDVLQRFLAERAASPDAVHGVSLR
jgi:CheY-like chemotaxis protein